MAACASHAWRPTPESGRLLQVRLFNVLSSAQAFNNQRYHFIMVAMQLYVTTLYLKSHSNYSVPLRWSHNYQHYSSVDTVSKYLPKKNLDSDTVTISRENVNFNFRVLLKTGSNLAEISVCNTGSLLVELI